MIDAVRRAAPDAEIIIEREDWREDDQGSVQVESSGDSVGSSLRTSSDEAAQSFNSQPATLALPGGLTLTGQGVSIQNELFSSEINPFYLLGGLLLVTAIVLAWLKRRTAAIWAGVGAAACIAVAVTIETVPFLWVWMLGLAMIGIVLWFWSEWKRGQAERDSNELSRSLRAVTKAVDAAPAVAGDAVKNRVKAAAEADPVIKERIKKAKL